MSICHRHSRLPVDSSLLHASRIISLALHLVPAPFVLTLSKLFLNPRNRFAHGLHIFISVLKPLLSCFSAGPASLFHRFFHPRSQFLLCRLPRFCLPRLRFPRLWLRTILRARLCMTRAEPQVSAKATLFRRRLTRRHGQHGQHRPSVTSYSHLILSPLAVRQGTRRGSRNNLTQYPGKASTLCVVAAHR